MNASRAMSGMVFTRLKEVKRKFIAGIQPQSSCQPHREEAATLFEVRLVYTLFPTQDGSSFGHMAQVVVRLHDQFRPAPEQSFYRTGCGVLVTVAPFHKAQQAAPFLLRLGRQMV